MVIIFICYWPSPTSMDAVLAIIVAGGRAWIWLHIEVDKNKLISTLIVESNKILQQRPWTIYALGRPPLHWIHATGGASSSTTMVVMFVVCLCFVMRSHLLYVKKVPDHNLKVRILSCYKVNRCYFLIHPGMHHACRVKLAIRRKWVTAQKKVSAPSIFPPILHPIQCLPVHHLVVHCLGMAKQIS